MARAIQRQDPADDDGGALLHRGDACHFQCLPVSFRRVQAPQIHGTVVALQDPAQHCIAEIPATLKRVPQGLVQRCGRFHQVGIERVVRLDRTATGRVGIEEELRHQRFQPRCSATIPPARLVHSMPSQPAFDITSASPLWSGQARIDSAR